MIIFINKLSKTIKNACKSFCFYSNKQQTYELKPPWKVLFFGSDDFSLASLKILKEHSNKHLISRLEVVTSPKQNVVRKYASQNNLPIHNWPLSESQKDFHLGVVVSFGHLIPESVINIFPMGMLNVHASLLPRWRGAAPIIYALASGDEKTGVSIMKIKPKRFDCGEILLRKAVDIPKDMKMPELYSKLAGLGADALFEAITRLPDILDHCETQSEEDVTLAPRITPKIAMVNWHELTALEVYNLSRAITGLYKISTYWNDTIVKLENVEVLENIADNCTDIKPGSIKFNKENKAILIQCKDGRWVCSDKIVINKKVISAVDFNNGYIKKQSLDNRLFQNKES